MCTSVLSLFLCSGFAPPRSASFARVRPAVQTGSTTVRTGSATLSMSAPAWPEILDRVQATPTGARLQRAAAARLVGQGPAHVDAPLRLFDAASEAEVRVVFYRDTAGWCPYCQKVWLLLEEKRIPFKVVKINMRSYGEKPSWFLQMVPGGLLPAIELDGQMMTDSLPIMQALDEAFPSEPRMVPRVGSAERTRASELLSLERELFSAWCSLTFQPGKGLLDSNERKMLDTMRRVDEALGATPGPFFLGGDTPTLVDLQYVSHVERMVPSLLFWKNLRLRGSKFAHLDRWLSAFEERPAYLATKSDFYTHVMDIPPQCAEREAAPCLTRETPTHPCTHASRQVRAGLLCERGGGVRS